MLKNILSSVLVVSVIGFLFFANYSWQSKVDHKTNAASKEMAKENKLNEVESNKNIYEKVKDKSNVKVLVLGDSIAESSGVENNRDKWYNQFSDLIKKEYGSKVIFDFLTRGGGTIFEGWLAYLNSNKLPTDMVILFYGQNDRGYMSKEDYGYLYEKLIRDIKKVNPQAEIMVVTESSIRTSEFPEELKGISDYYQFLNVQTAKKFEESGTPYNELTDDKVHPNAKGYKIYANEMLKVFSDKYRNAGDIAELPKNYLYSEDVYNEAKYVFDLQENNGFQRTDISYESEKKDDSLSFITNGPILGINVYRDIDGGMLDVYVDGNLIKKINTWAPVRVKKDTFISADLGEGEHVVKLVNSGEKGKDYEGNDSEGTIIRFINGVYGVTSN